MTSRSQSNVPLPMMKVDSAKNSEDSEASLSKSISSSYLLSSESVLNGYGKSEVTLRSSRRLAIGRKTSQRKSHNPSISLKLHETIHLTCENFQSNYHTSNECSKLFVPGSTYLPKFILEYTFKAINVQGDGNCGYREVSHYIYKTQDQWAYVRGDLAE
ncbi:hypothetical protein O181_105391 [Austropuccinia psidii MF-1]|uniref:OTU domain-containing protein n=1 Tax=Austropuccinia psidii MF-1 TaxID=1389203 RepID=A0A9Q3JPE2_9BASI|nr:hypothetical protein [Austropuccinia psidii MF-1]